MQIKKYIYKCIHIYIHIYNSNFSSISATKDKGLKGGGGNKPRRDYFEIRWLEMASLRCH